MGGDRGIPVLDLAVRGRVWLLSENGRSAVPAEGEMPCHGFGLPYPEPFSAVFAYSGRMWLQVGERRWDVADITAVRLVSESAAAAEYVVEFADRPPEPIEIAFPDDVARWRRLEPVRDEFDAVSEDIMRLLPYQAPDGWVLGEDDIATWATRMTAFWSAGISSR